MKKTLALMLAVVLAFTLAACGGITGGSRTSGSDSPSGGKGGNPSGGKGDTPSGGDVITSTSSSDVKIGDIVQFGGNDWRVLDIQDGKALLLSDKVLTMQSYHESKSDITWEKSSMREFLNGSFFESTFTSKEKDMIVETTISNKDNQWHGTDGGNDTNDKVFLLSIEEVIKYFGDSGQLKNGNSDNDDNWIGDEYSSARIAYDADGKDLWWWLRSPGYTSDMAAFIFYDGDVLISGIFVNTDYGVRPALWVNLSGLSPSGGGNTPSPAPEAPAGDTSGLASSASPLSSSAAAGDIVSFGPYDWRVLDVQDGKALILSDKILLWMDFHLEFISVTWEECDLRQYLNGEFFDETFTTAEKALIAETQIETKDHPWYGMWGGGDTTDKVFLLSTEEVVQYFGDSGQLANGDPNNLGCIDDEYNSARIAYRGDGEAKFWWLRSPAYSSRSTAAVHTDGRLCFGHSINTVVGEGGVRPAIWVKL